MTILELFPDWAEHGVFALLATHTPPWGTGAESALDLAYMAHSAKKAVAPIVELLTINGEVSSTAKQQLIASLFNLNAVKWEKLYATLSLEYNPIENYSMTENSNSSHNDTHTGTVGTTGSAETAIAGFDSSDYADSSKNTSSTTQTNNLTDGGTAANHLTRSGNIGITTSQMMIESELSLWQWRFFDTVFDDIDNFLTLSVY